MHLVAELLDNATHFSPPDSVVEVIGDAPVPGTYRIRIRDHGIGMSAGDLAAAAADILGTRAAVSPSRRLGLDVVGRLAARHNLQVALDPAVDHGVVVTVTLPASALTRLSELPPPPPPPDAAAAAPVFMPSHPHRHAEVPDAPARPVPAPAIPSLVSVARDRGQAVPRRIRGAQLPDLGPAGDGTPRRVPDPRRVRGRLNTLQAGLVAARTNSIPPAPRPHPPTPAAGDAT